MLGGGERMIFERVNDIRRAHDVAIVRAGVRVLEALGQGDERVERDIARAAGERVEPFEYFAAIGRFSAADDRIEREGGLQLLTLRSLAAGEDLANMNHRVIEV